MVTCLEFTVNVAYTVSYYQGLFSCFIQLIIRKPYLFIWWNKKLVSKVKKGGEVGSCCIFILEKCCGGEWMSSSGYGGTNDVGSSNHAVLLLWACSTGHQNEKTPLSDWGWGLASAGRAGCWLHGRMCVLILEHWTKVGNCWGESQEWRFGCFCQAKGSWKAAWLLLVSKPQGRVWTLGRICKLSW